MNIADQLLAIFDDPTSIWKTVFDQHIGDLDRRVFLTIATVPSPVSLSDLEQIVRSQANAPLSLRDFEPTLKVLDDTFIRIDQPYIYNEDGSEYQSTQRLISFRNPGLLDFAQSCLEAQPDYLQALAPFTRFEQVQHIVGMAFEQRTASGSPMNPRLRAYVMNQAESYVSMAAELFTTKPTASRGVGGIERFQAFLLLLKRLRVDIKGPAGEAAHDVTQTVWRTLVKLPPRIDVALLLRKGEVIDTLTRVLGNDPVAEYIQAVLSSRPIDLDKVRILEELRTAGEIAPDETERVRSDIAAFLRERLEAIDYEDDHEEMARELSFIEDLDYWMDDDLFNEVVGGFQGRLEEIPHGGDYEDSDGGPRRTASEAEAGDDEVEVLLSGLRDRPDM